jgi:hypothetical protein
MAAAIMAHPDLRHPFERKALNSASSATVLYAGKVFELKQALIDGALWVTPEDLTLINGFELKPEGACFEALCIPLRDDSALLKKEADQQWFNLTSFAALLEQPCVADIDNKIWSFGEVPAKREGMISDAMAPDFELIDRQGDVIRMSDYKGKKALIITWSSW